MKNKLLSIYAIYLLFQAGGCAQKTLDDIGITTPPFDSSFITRHDEPPEPTCHIERDTSARGYEYIIRVCTGAAFIVRDTFEVRRVER